MSPFLLLRWSRCLLPSPRMWLETWTTKTWFTSLLMERRRTRSEPSFKCIREVESQFVYPAMTWNWLTAHKGNVDYLLSFYDTIASVLSSLESRGRILTNSLFPACKNGKFTASNIIKCRALFLLYPQHIPHIHLRLIKLFFLIIFYTNNHMPVFTIASC